MMCYQTGQNSSCMYGGTGLSWGVWVGIQSWWCKVATSALYNCLVAGIEKSSCQLWSVGTWSHIATQDIPCQQVCAVFKDNTGEHLADYSQQQDSPIIAAVDSVTFVFIQSDYVALSHVTWHCLYHLFDRGYLILPSRSPGEQLNQLGISAICYWSLLSCLCH